MRAPAAPPLSLRLFVQAYIHTVPRYAETVLLQMNQSIVTPTSWMAANRLLLNPSKTQAIWLGGHRQLAKIDCQRLSSLFPHIIFSTSVRDIGVMLDPELTFSQRINLVGCKCTIGYASLGWFPDLLPTNRDSPSSMHL